ncbi:riboflavin synthase [Haloglomus litoreum]|uniref:riboflavin synthase n=1 Tax=Haloglomus litoreum TaxID=3034026 RepID=UPI0023E8E32F|nr:riboflavin synthase [Haloglomus sp. DT116]
MYTGIVEATGTVRETTAVDGGHRLRLGTPFTDIQPGDSVAVHGVCLTAEQVGDGWFEAFCSAETVDRTYLADLPAGSAVNIERPVRADDRLDGHVVKGTVDTVTSVRAVERDGDTVRYRLERPDEPYLVEKGAVALDGASLTVTDVTPREFAVATIPETRERTTLSGKAPGDPVHVEFDVLARYARATRPTAAD